MATATVPSATVLAKKAELVQQADQWRTVRDAKTGQRVIVMPNCDGSRVYYVQPDGKACSCKAGQHGIICAHRLAAIERANHDALEAWLSAPVEPKPADRASPKPLKRYEDICPPCAQIGCQDSPEPRERYCWRHLTVDAF